MKYLSVKEIATKWDVSQRTVRNYCAQGKIAHVFLTGKTWNIPEDARKPSRKKKRVRYIYPEPPDFKVDSPFSIQDILGEEKKEYAKLLESDMAYLQGDFQTPKDYYSSLSRTNEKKVVAAAIAIVCAISTGDYKLYQEISEFCKEAEDRVGSEREKRICQIPILTARLSMYAVEGLPTWLMEGDISEFSRGLRMVLFHLYLMYLVSEKANIEVYAVAKQARVMNAKKDTYNYLDLYFLLYQGYGARCLGYEEEAIKCVDEALDYGIPLGIISPFSELLILLGGLLEERIQLKYPAFEKKIRGTWGDTYKHWIGFHNQFAKDEVTNILTIQEMHVATLLVRGLTYEQCAKKMHLSIGRIKNIIQDIYSKLYIKNKKELKKFVP